MAHSRFHYYTIPKLEEFQICVRPTLRSLVVQSTEGWPGRESVQLFHVFLIITISALIHPLITQCAQLRVSQSEAPFATCLQIIGLSGQVKVVIHCVRAFIGPF